MVNNLDHSLQEQNRSLSSVVGHQPGRFWVGCSDSPVSVFDLAMNPGTLVHSNPGNLALPTDMSLLASLKMAVDTYGVSEIIVCGHYGCRSVEAAASGIREEVLGDWLAPLKTLAGRNSGLRASSDGNRSIADALADLNVVEQTRNVSQTGIVRDAWANGRQLSIVGMIFDPVSGRLSRIGEPISSAFRSDFK